jgi:hypothetical protein
MSSKAVTDRYHSVNKDLAHCHISYVKIEIDRNLSQPIGTTCFSSSFWQHKGRNGDSGSLVSFAR